jgi:CRISPR-associated Csx2 family protein
MSHKIFISFLGTNDYTECVYCYGTYRSRVVKFVQLALTEMCCKNWKENDAILIFTTKQALANWEKLQHEFNLPVHISNVPIPSGSTEEEIWQIFQIMYDSLQVGDELYLDITNSFRSIPLLASALMQYAKFLKKISVKAIYYGAFETLGNPRDIKDRIPDPENRIAPIFDLTAFSEIQDWSVAANNFISFGNASQLSKLTKDDINPILRQTEGANEIAKLLQKLVNNIDTLSLNIKTNRGCELIEGKVSASIIEILGSLKQDLITPLNPILNNLQKSIELIYQGNNERMNMLLAVKWCIDKQLIQEGYTILQEGIISYLLDDYLNKDKRQFVSAYLNCYNKLEKLESKTNNQFEELKAKLNDVPEIKRWADLYYGITALRNDINHAGMNSSSCDAKKFEKMLVQLYENVFQLINNR